MTVEIATLLKLDIERNLTELINLSPPEKSPLTECKSKQVYEVVNHFKDLWFSLLLNKVNLPDVRIEIPCPGCEKKVVFEGDSLWDRVCLVTASYYDFAMRELMTRNYEKKGLIPGFEVHYLDKMIALASAEDTPLHLHQVLTFAIGYQLCNSSHFFFKLCEGIVPLPSTIATFESISHGSLWDMYSKSRSKNTSDIEWLMKRLFSSSLRYVTSTYQAMKGRFDSSHSPGMFSNIKVNEISLLGKRDKQMIDKYGRKNVEAAFEQQLALIIQSFGFSVVPAQKGERKIDLVCVSGLVSTDQRDNYSFLLEAKTSGKPYSLPTDDQRAIKEYVTQSRRALHGIPQLQFVLIVGYKPTKTLLSKLKQLESSAGIPIRFCSTQQISKLRESLPGPVPMLSFKENIIAGPPIMTDKSIENITDTYTGVQKAYADYISNLYSLHESRPDDALSWPDGECHV